MVSLTFDTDWVHEIAVEYVLNLLDDYNVDGVFFSTSEYTCLKEDIRHEVAIHPNFNDILSGDSNLNFQSKIKQLFEIYPFACGLRSHSLTQSSQILNFAYQSGIKYDSNLYHPLSAKAYKDYSGLVRFTHSYVDLGQLLDLEKDGSLTSDYIKFFPDSLTIFDFHPVHIFVNTPTITYYNDLKKYTQDYKELKSRINNKQFGIRDIFVNLLEKIQSEKHQTVLLKNEYAKVE